MDISIDSITNMQVQTTGRFKRVAAIHDLSGIGRCSLNVIMPILSVMQVQSCPIPTAIFSAHTGIGGTTVKSDLSDHIMPTLNHYIFLNAKFDCIYTGFIGQKQQIDSLEMFFSQYPKSFKVVDPVMGNNGKFYKGFDQSLRDGIKSLVKKADLIIPNLTECCELLGQNYPHEPLPREKIKTMLLKLAQFGPDAVILTGITLIDGRVCNVGYDKTTSCFWCSYYSLPLVSYPGTGDVFSAVVVGSLLQGYSFPTAIETATRFIEIAAKITYGYKTPPQEGLLLEAALPWLGKEHFLKEYESF